MSTSRRPPPTPGLRLFAPLSVLGAAIVLALAVHPQWSTILIMAALAVLGAGRSLFRAEKWQPPTTSRPFASDSSWSSPPSSSAMSASRGGRDRRCAGTHPRRLRRVRGTANQDHLGGGRLRRIRRCARRSRPLRRSHPGLGMVGASAGHLLLPLPRGHPHPPRLETAAAAVGPAQDDCGKPGILLLTAGSPLAVENPWIGIMSAAIALAALVISFGRDVLWLEQHAEARRPTPSR